MQLLSSAPPSSFDLPATRASPIVALYSPFHCSSGAAGCPLTFSASVYNGSFLLSRTGRNRMKHSRRVVVVRAKNFSLDYDEKGDGDGHGVSEGRRFGGGRSTTQKAARQELEEPAARARVAWTSQDQARASLLSPQKQQDRASWTSGKHQTRAPWPSENQRPSQNQHRNSFSSQNQHRNSFSSQNQHSQSFSSQNQARNSWSPEKQQTWVSNARVSSLSQNQPSRLHNKFSPFGRITEPDTFRLSSNNVAATSFLSPGEEDASPKFNREKPSYSRGLRHRVQNPQPSFQNSQQESFVSEDNPVKGSMFKSKLEEILSKFQKKDSFSKRSSFIEGLNDEGTKDADAPSLSQDHSNAVWGLQDTRREGNMAQANGVWKPIRKDMQGARNTDFSLRTSVKDAYRKDARKSRQVRYEEGRFSSMNDTEKRQSDLGKWRSSTNGKENAGGDHEAGSAPMNLFASPPPVPWETDRRYSSASKSPTSIRKRNVNVSVRRISTSIGSRSSPSRSSVLGRNPKHSKPDSQSGRGNTGVLNSSGRAKQTEPWFKNKEGSEMRGLPELEEDEVTAHIGFQKPRAQKSVEPVENVKFDWTDLDTEDDADNGLSSPSYAEDDAATASSSGVRSLHDKKSNQPAAGTHSNHSSSAIPSMGVNISESGSSDGGDSSRSASWHKHNQPDLPFEFQYSYSENPNAPILRYREPPYSPFGPTTMERPWTGRAPLKQSKKKLPEFDSFNPPPREKKGIKFVQDPGPYSEGQGPKPAKSREEIVGEPLTNEEIVYLVEKCHKERRQLNLGRDGLTHNMLDLIHCHWKRRRVCKVKCIGVPTVDMDNVCHHIEHKTGGKIIYRTGGVLYLFRGRNYNYKDRPKIPLMLWKPVAPVYPKLIQRAPEGLTKEEADKLRLLGRKVEPMCQLGKNGVYLTLVEDVRNAFKVDDLVLINCEGLNPSDYKKIGAKLRDLVPCVLLSFDKEHILMWKGKAKASSDADMQPPDEGVSSTENPDVVDAKTSISCDAGDLEGEMIPEAGVPMELSLQKGQGNEDVLDDLGGKEGQDGELINSVLEGCQAAYVVVRVDGLWDHAIASGMAVELDGADADSDLVAKKAGELAQAAPTGPVYTRNLLSKLQVKKEEKESPDGDLQIQFGRLQNLKRRKKIAKRAFQLPTIDVPRMGGLPVDELARLLAPK